MKKSKLIVPVCILTLTLGICGYTKTNPDINPIDIINRINGNNSITSPIKDSVQKENTPTPKTPEKINTTNKGTSSEKIDPRKDSLTNPINQGYLAVNPIDIVKNPAFYLGKKIKFQAKFDKFSTLGLDYTPVKRSSEDYITVLIQRPDVISHDIPLSELKIFMNRKEAEKHIDLNSGDEIEIAGKVFAKALGDAWMDAENFTVIKTIPKVEK